MHCADANKYLAEDRIMCLEIIAKEDSEFILNYVPGAKCLTDPPLSLTGLIKQRRRWFNGSLFASIHVLKNMCSIWRRKHSSWKRNLFFMFLYLFMQIQMVLSIIIVGTFYAVFTIFIRAIFKADKCVSITSEANITQNVYILFLFFSLLLSTTIDISCAENGFRFCSFIMGLFTLLMIGSSIVFAIQEDIQSIGVISMIIFLMSYLIPLFVNIKNVKFCDFVKGLVYVTYLSPTYVNIFTIYSISNIHDVSWGSRPAAQDGKSFQETEKKKETEYKDFRSGFLIVWCVLNASVGYGITYLYQSGDTSIVFYLAAFLVSVNMLRIILSLVHLVVSTIDRYRVTSFKKSMKSNVFKDFKKDEEAGVEEAFVIYYDEIREDSEIRLSSINDPAYRKSTIRSSIRDEKVFRGFDVSEIDRKQKIANGTKKVNRTKSSYQVGSGEPLLVIYDVNSSDSEDSDYQSNDKSMVKQSKINLSLKSNKSNISDYQSPQLTSVLKSKSNKDVKKKVKFVDVDSNEDNSNNSKEVKFNKKSNEYLNSDEKDVNTSSQIKENEDSIYNSKKSSGSSEEDE